jgi:hypothetical protein
VTLDLIILAGAKVLAAVMLIICFGYLVLEVHDMSCRAHRRWVKWRRP